MPSSTSSSKPWRGFFRALVGVAVAGGALVYAFVVLVDPFGALPLSLPITRWPVDGNARYAFPALARNPAFDSAVFGTSTSRLLRPATLDPLFGARFANLAMNAATAYEQAALMTVFTRNHPRARAVLVGLDVEWCPTGDDLRRFTERAFPAWMYGENRWAGYAHMFDLYAVQKAGQAFAEFAGLKRRVYGGDGYTSFTPPDETYDAVRAAAHLREWGTFVPAGPRDGPASEWRFPALELLRQRLDAMAPATRKVLFFVPYSRAVLPKAGEDRVQAAWDECKRRVAALASEVPNATAIDFMVPSEITGEDTNYWDGLHYRQPIAERVARDLARAAAGGETDDGAARVPSRAR